MKEKFRRSSIGTRMFLVMGVVLLLQTGLITGSIIGSGAIERLSEDSYDIFNQQIITRKNYLEYEMISWWSNLMEAEQEIEAHFSQVLEKNNAGFDEIETNSDLAVELLRNSAADVIEFLRRNGVTGAFLVLEGSPAVDDNGNTVKSGLYFRNMNPSTASLDNSDLLVERAPTAITKELGIPMDSEWHPVFLFSGENDQRNLFYQNPIRAAQSYPEAEPKELGYWSKPFYLDERSVPVITYSMPLRAPDGTVYGVLGVEITLDYLSKLLPYTELSEETNVSYVLAVRQPDSNQYVPVMSTGPLYTYLYSGGDGVLTAGEPVRENCFSLVDNGNFTDTTYACVQQMKLYNNNAPFENDQWVLMGVIENRYLFGAADSARTTFFLAVALTLLIGAASIFLTIRSTTHPIQSLVNQVRGLNPRQPVRFQRIHIREFDELTNAIETLGEEVADSASKLSQIVEMASFPLGAFEYTIGGREVYFTTNFFKIFLIGQEKGLQYLPLDRFKELMLPIAEYIDPALSTDKVKTFRLTDSQGSIVWVRLKLIDSEQHMLGIAEDVTQEMVEKQKIEYERDYDLLTNLLNRRAFHSRMRQLFQNRSRMKVAALIMMDLDNLKYINDTFGHDYGDQYIRAAANALRIGSPKNAVISRMSGDEFYLFLYGYDSEDQARERIDRLQKSIQTSTLELPNRPSFRIRASAGVAWYPKDSESYEQLIRYADFAMYSVKNMTKGRFAEFNITDYEKSAYLLHNSEELNRLIEEELLDYYFQPIVNARTGQVFGYEALMRPRLTSLETPLEVLSLAKSQGKLYQIERLTWFLALKSFTGFKNIPPDCRLFINSIANQGLSESDEKALEAQYGPYLGSLVVELTEEEERVESYTRKKISFLKRHGGQVALDDFGAGYNGEVSLLAVRPDFIKVDLSIVRNCHQDKNRQEMISNIISFARKNNSLVIAEGVQSREEMDTVISLGVDYLQGYYVGVPSLTSQPIPDKILKEITSRSR